jgi:hypothetical protein
MKNILKLLLLSQGKHFRCGLIYKQINKGSTPLLPIIKQLLNLLQVSPHFFNQIEDEYFTFEFLHISSIKLKTNPLNTNISLKKRQKVDKNQNL